MAKQRIKLIQGLCRRGCGKLLCTTNRSLCGNDSLKKEFELICNDCLTPEEHKRMDDIIENAMLRTMRGQ